MRSTHDNTLSPLAEAKLHNVLPPVNLSYGQLQVSRAIDYSKITIVIGDIGYGKSTIALQSSLQRLVDKKCKKILLTSPLGNPDIVFDSLIHNYTQGNEISIEERIVYSDIKELARSTIKNSIVILDESQYATTEEVSSLVDRLGRNSKLVILIDTLQSVVVDVDNKENNFARNFIRKYYTSNEDIGDKDLQVVMFKPIRDYIKSTTNLKLKDFFRNL